LPAQIDMAFRGVGERGRAGTKQALQFIGAEGRDRRQAGQQQRRHGNQPAAAGDGIDEAGDKAGQRKHEDDLCGKIGHGGTGIRAGDKVDAGSTTSAGIAQWRSRPQNTRDEREKASCS
jgi:hypothetical protein